MDKNKLQKLREIEYTIKECCGICAHSAFYKNPSDWSMCAVITYNHQKHTEELRQLSINKYGWCSKFKKSKYLNLEKFKEFME